MRLRELERLKEEERATIEKAAREHEAASKELQEEKSKVGFLLMERSQTSKVHRAEEESLPESWPSYEQSEDVVI